ncbi:MAG: flagellar motor switch protein FliM [Verrucomicrobia bacterium GWC2_42_7]|nr:MAG: flagellar motor switch protein FliM [Verrucomicrobia bacterium GWC2_42_7]
MEDESTSISDQVSQADINQVLAQGDIDQLVSQAIVSPEVTIYRPGVKRKHSEKKTTVEAYDFRNPVFLTEIELRQIRIKQEHFIHYLAARLSMFLRMDFSLKLSKLFTTPYVKFTEAIPNPTFISLFNFDQLNGVGVIDVNPRLAMTIVNRMLGGKGHSIKEERYLTEIEIALMDDVIKILLEEWCRQWNDIRELNVSLVGTENNGRFLQTSPQDTIILVIDLQAGLGDCSETIQIGVPYYMIEPLIKELQASSKNFNHISSLGAKEAQWSPNYDDINITVSAEWDCFDLTVQDLLRLRVGDVLELPKDILAKTQLKFENSTHFVGEIGLEDEKVAVKITDNFKISKNSIP